MAGLLWSFGIVDTVQSKFSRTTTKYVPSHHFVLKAILLFSGEEEKLERGFYAKTSEAHAIGRLGAQSHSNISSTSHAVDP